ncbi:hypothetical protein JQC92_02420 [Shewanella sp. 202IG2-18]|uniref:hypothetical protein n=1 Tax=Parashewanella hymeniacidonis TaxID=2807618 RepID=UPI00195F61AA|nr:hypothetical protein [Parashewanella hymeniacidonis]MBM7070896.1 hypothetical protein [Parashewanella hymeniacidonis]
MGMLAKELPEDAPSIFDFISEPSNEPEVKRLKFDKSVQDIKPKRSYPLHWYARGGNSDKRFVMQRMSVIPKELKHQVSIEYEKLIHSKGRKAANFYLNDAATMYR